MLRLPSRFAAVILCFAPLFRERSWRHAEVLLVGAILAPGRRTVASALRAAGLGHAPGFANYHRVLSEGRWSGRALARQLLVLLVAAFALRGRWSLLRSGAPTMLVYGVVAVAGADRVAVDAFGGDAPAAPALDGVVEAEDQRAARREGVQQQAQQHAPGCPSAPGGAVQHAMVVGEPPLAAEPGDPEDAGHGALARRQNGPDQQHLRMPPTALAEERREA